TNKRGVANKPPTANAGGNKTLILPNNSIALTGLGTDSDGTITAYLWEKTSGSSVTMNDVNKATLKLTNLVEGIYTFRLTVTDDKGATASAQARITVNPEPKSENQAPVVNVGEDKTLTLPENSTVMNGSGEDRDGEIDSYLW